MTLYGFHMSLYVFQMSLCGVHVIFTWISYACIWFECGFECGLYITMNVGINMTLNLGIAVTTNVGI